MLTEDRVEQCRAQLQRIRSGAEPVPACAAENAEILMRAVRYAENGHGISDWINWHIKDLEFITCIKDSLRLFCGEVPHVLTFSDYARTILEHHYWNDCDVYWYEKPMRGCYGENPGEDILIKLLANEY